MSKRRSNKRNKSQKVIQHKENNQQDVKVKLILVINYFINELNPPIRSHRIAEMNKNVPL